MRLLVLTLAGLVFAFHGPVATAGDAGSARKPLPTLPVESPGGSAPADTLSLTEALARVRRANPTLGAIAQRTRAALAAVDQAGARPNPGLSLEFENVGWGYSGLDRSEVTLQISQEFELGGKRSNRISVASAGADAARFAAATDSFLVYVEVASRYAAIAHAEERASLAQAEKSLIEQIASSAAERVRAGAALVADGMLGEAALEEARISEADARVALDSARRALSILWNEAGTFDTPVSRRWQRALPPASSDSIAAWVERSPLVRTRRMEARQAVAMLGLERSMRVPSLVASAGVRRVEEEGVNTLVFGVGLPLPVFDRRAGAIAAQAATTRQAEMGVEQARADIRGELDARLARLAALKERLARTNATLLPMQRGAFESLRNAYAIGRVSYSDLLDAERGYLDLLIDRNDLGLAIALESLAIEALLGRNTRELMPHED